MTPSDLKPFGELFKRVWAYYGKDAADDTLTMFWDALQGFDLDQVRRAFSAHMLDPERGQFAPRIADLARTMIGTHGDRAALAWGKVYEAMSRVGAHRSVVFDDAAIHAAIADLGGWPKVCRTPIDELGYVQAAFCKSYRAYVGRGQFDYPNKLIGEADCADDLWHRKGLTPPKPAMVGDQARAAAVLAGGSAGGRVAIAMQSGLQPLALGAPAANDPCTPKLVA